MGVRTLASVVWMWLGLAVAPALAQREPNPPPPPAPAFRVVVHRANTSESMTRSFLADVFLKRTTRWPTDDGAIRPVDLPIGSQVRRRFIEQVLRRSVAAVRNYWQQVIFSGRGLPPAELDGDDAVLRYVRRHPGAIGYVSGGAPLEGVRAVRVN